MKKFIDKIWQLSSCKKVKFDDFIFFICMDILVWSSGLFKLETFYNICSFISLFVHDQFFYGISKKMWCLSMGQNDICTFSLALPEECVA